MALLALLNINIRIIISYKDANIYQGCQLFGTLEVKDAKDAKDAKRGCIGHKRINSISLTERVEKAIKKARQAKSGILQGWTGRALHIKSTGHKGEIEAKRFKMSTFKTSLNLNTSSHFGLNFAQFLLFSSPSLRGGISSCLK
jgi:hypothetical protein